MNTRTKTLLDLMAANNLSIAEVAKILNRSPQTVRVWRCKTDRTRIIPEHSLEVLKTKIASLSA